MENVLDFDRQRKALSDAADVFLSQNFSPSHKSIKVLMDHDLVVIRVDNFLCRAEIEMGKERRDTKIIHEMYSTLFDRVKAALVTRIEQITRKKVKSSQMNINFESELCIMDFHLTSLPDKGNMRLALLAKSHEKE